MKKIGTIVIVVAMLGLAGGMNSAYAASAIGVGGSAQARLNFQVSIPKILFLQIGSLGATIDTVSFDVTGLPEDLPMVSGDSAPTVRVAAIVATGGSLILSANSSVGMTGASTGTNMPFSVIRMTGTGGFSSISSMPFNGTASQSVWTGTGGGSRTGTIAYEYSNTYSYQPDTYSGQVTYTLSSP